MRRVVRVDADETGNVATGGQRVLDVPLGAGLIHVVSAHVLDRDLCVLDRGPNALKPLAGVVGVRQASEGDALAALWHGLDQNLSGLLAGFDIAGAQIKGSLACGRVAVRGGQHRLACDLVQGFGLGLGIDGADHDAGRSPRYEVVHEAVLNGRRGLLWIFDLYRIVRQFGLRLLHAGFRQLPEVDGAVGNEAELLFLRGIALPAEKAIAMAVVAARNLAFIFVLLVEG